MIVDENIGRFRSDQSHRDAAQSGEWRRRDQQASLRSPCFLLYVSFKSVSLKINFQRLLDLAFDPESPYPMEWRYESPGVMSVSPLSSGYVCVRLIP